jgi:hypothetical protein
MGKAKALLISICMAALAVAGAATAMHGVSLGPASAKPAPVAAGAIAASESKLDRWSAQLRRQRSTQPPRLPAIPHFARVQIPTLAPLHLPVTETITPADVTTQSSQPAADMTATSPVATTTSEVAALLPPATTTTGEPDGLGDGQSSDDGQAGNDRHGGDDGDGTDGGQGSDD